ncbi:hypothetical protein BGZ49_008911 [Haplosporangium sp. Z 27]|nr:hypothetical protein BGZ49_008911 [Haplosporangium sp. Z 27]
MESASTPRANQPKAGLRRPNYGPMQQRVLRKYPTTPHVTRRRTILDDSVLEALHQTHIGPPPNPSRDGASNENGDTRNESAERDYNNNTNERRISLTTIDNQEWTSVDASTLQYMPQTPRRESHTFTIAPGSGRRTPRRRSRLSNQHLRTTPLKALADANQARVNRLISEANKRGRVGRDKHSPMGILRILSRIPGFNPPAQSLSDRQAIAGSANWRKLTPKPSRTNHIQIPDDLSNPFSAKSNHSSHDGPHFNSSRFERDPLSSAERRAYEKFRDQNPFLDPDDFNRLWEDELGVTREGGRLSFGVRASSEYDALTEDGDTRDFTVIQGDMTDPFSNPQSIEERSIHIGDITNTSQHGFLAEHGMRNANIDGGNNIDGRNNQTMARGDYLEYEAELEASDLQSSPNTNSLALSASQQTSEDADIESGGQTPLDGTDISNNLIKSRDDNKHPHQEQEFDMNMDDGWEDILDEGNEVTDSTTQYQVPAAADAEMENHLNETNQDEDHINGDEVAIKDQMLPDKATNEMDQSVPEEEQLDYEDGYINVNDEDHIEQQEHDEQQDRPGVHYFDDFPSELGIMSSGNVLPTSIPAPKKKVRLSAAGIPVPSMPTSLQKQLVNTFSRSRVSQEAMAVILEGSYQFFEQAANDLAAYADHAGRKTIDESDVECLMKRLRITNERVSIESLLQRYLPRELRDKVLYPEDMQHFRGR